MIARKVVVACAVAVVACLAWLIAPPLGVLVVLVGAAVAAAWFSPVYAGERHRARHDAEVAARRVDREVETSLTDEALAWAVGTWRKRYL